MNRSFETRDAHSTAAIDCLQSAFSLRIRLVLDLIQRDCKPRCYHIGIETRREKTVDSLVVNKPSVSPETEYSNPLSIAQLLTDHWLVCDEIAYFPYILFPWKNSHNLQSDRQGSCQRIWVLIMRISHASQTAPNNSEASSNLSNKTFKDILQKETAVINFLKGNEFKAILRDLKKV